MKGLYVLPVLAHAEAKPQKSSAADKKCGWQMLKS